MTAVERIDDLWALARQCGEGDVAALEAFPDLAKSLLSLAGPGPHASDAERVAYLEVWNEVRSMLDSIVLARAGIA